jgi:thymidylate synthase ThyX
MANIISQDYDLSLGVTIPDSIKETRQENHFMEMIDKTESFYLRLEQKNPLISPYILTNAHRRRVLFKINLRELYHFSRLREDQHAQWDIRQIASQMISSVRSYLPFSGALLAGKDQFESVYQKFMQS